MGESGSRPEMLRALAVRLELDMSDMGLLDRALTHSSALAEMPELPGNNESLEFLGDAVLGLAVAQWLYQRIPELSPGDYTQMRARVVNKRTLASIAGRLDLGSAVRLSRGEEAAGGRQRSGLLADSMEAIIGAVFLDGGWKPARNFIERVFSEELEQTRSKEADRDYRSRLQQYCQAQQWPLPEFEVIREEGPDHRKEFEVSVRLEGEVAGRGTGMSKKEAEQNAARAALEHEGELK